MKPKSTIYYLIKNNLKLKYFNYEYVPKILSKQQKEERINKCKKLMSLFGNSEFKKYYKVITRDET